MAKVRQLFFDRLLELYEQECKRPLVIAPELAPTTSATIRSDLTKRVFLQGMQSMLQQSHLFLLNGAVADDLYHIPPEVTDYDSLKHLPFSLMFFELMDPIEFGRLQGSAVPLHGILLSTGESDPRISHAYRLAQQYGKIQPAQPMFVASLFYNQPTTGCDTFMFDAELASRTSGTQFDFFEERSRYGFLPTSQTQKVEKEAFCRIGDFCTNIVSYINAHNVTIRSIDRTIEEHKLEVMNRKRRKRGELPLAQPKPYHWIDIRQHVLSERHGREGSELAYREWVRGHFQHYHTSEGIRKSWVEAYVRGPPDKPWKEARYRVLADMLDRGPKPD